MRNHTDMRIQSETLAMGKVPQGKGWELWSGNSTHNEWYRIVRVDHAGEVDKVLIHSDVWLESI